MCIYLMIILICVYDSFALHVLITCLDVNLANKFVWVRKGANPHGPKRVWVSKATLILFDAGVGSRLT